MLAVKSDPSTVKVLVDEAVDSHVDKALNEEVLVFIVCENKFKFRKKDRKIRGIILK
jgi:hypothetical protein